MRSVDDAATLKLPSFRLNSSPDALLEWRKIFLTKSPVRYPKRSIIVPQGTYTPNVFFIVGGLVELTHINRAGAERLLEVIGEGSIINLQPVISGTPATGAFITLEECVLASISRDELYEYMGCDKRLAEELLEEMAAIISGLNQQVWVHAETAANRIERTVYMLAMNRLDRGYTGRELLIGLSQNDLARIAQTTRVTATKVLSDLKRKGLVDTVYGGILVRDLSRLTELVYHEE